MCRNSDTADAATAGSLVTRGGGRIRSVIADGAYDGTPIYAAISRLKAPWGDRLTARSLAAQRKEVALRISTANMAIRHAKPVTVRIA